MIEPPRSDGILLIPTVPKLQAAHTGWIAFAGILMVLAAIGNLIFGFFEILNDYYFTGDTVAAGYHSLWGWLYIGAGVCVLLIVPLVFMRNPVGIFLATVVVVLNALTHALGFGKQPAWSIVALALDAVVLYALVTYGVRVAEPRRRASA